MTAIMATFLWADCHTHGPHKSTHLDSCSAVGLVDEGNAIWAYNVVTFLWLNCYTLRLFYLHYLHQVFDVVHNSVKQ